MCVRAREGEAKRGQKAKDAVVGGEKREGSSRQALMEGFLKAREGGQSLKPDPRQEGGRHPGHRVFQKGPPTVPRRSYDCPVTS